MCFTCTDKRDILLPKQLIKNAISLYLSLCVSDLPVQSQTKWEFGSQPLGRCLNLKAFEFLQKPKTSALKDNPVKYFGFIFIIIMPEQKTQLRNVCNNGSEARGRELSWVFQCKTSLLQLWRRCSLVLGGRRLLV